MQNTLTSDIKNRYLYYGVTVILLIICVLAGLFESYKVMLITFLIPVLIFFFLNFSKYFKFLFVASLFFGGYYHGPLRLSLALICGSIIIFFFITYRDSNFFNDLLLPNPVLLSAFSIVFAVFLSSVLTPFISFSSVYFGFLFFVFVFTSYIFFRSVKTSFDIDRILYSFVQFTFLSSIIILIQIFVTGYLRSTGITSFPIIDFSVVALITMLFRNFLLSEINKKSVIMFIVIFIILITTQSRFAWLGFFLTTVYGTIICYIYSEKARNILRKRFFIIIFSLLIGIALFYIMGLNNIFSNRISDISFSFFQNNEEGKLVSNSLETRLFIWIVALNTFIHNPVFGVGYLMFSEVSDNYNVLPEFIFNVFVKGLDAHTTYLNFLCETGIIGLICFLIYIITIFRYSLKSIKLSKDINELKVSIVLNLLVFFIMVHSIYSGAFTMGQNAMLMHLIFGLAIGNYSLLKKRSQLVSTTG